MAKMTLKEMTVNILAALEEDDVEHIDDTPSAAQVVEVLKEVYYQIVSNDVVPELQSLFRLSDAPSSENSLLTIPTEVGRIDWIKYNKIISGATRPDYKDVKYLTPEEFLTITDARDSTQSEVEAVTDPTSSNITVYVYNDRAPTYWTSFDDTYIFFDSYDSAVDASGLVASKTKCFGQKVPTWTASNSFTPAL